MPRRFVAGSQGRFVSRPRVNLCRPRVLTPFPLLLSALVVAAGCGSENPLGRRPISGKVALQGQPVDYGSIQFIPLDLQHGVNSGAMINNGIYRITEEQGLPPGKYKVMISSPDRGKKEKYEGPPGDERTLAVERIPKKYNLETTLDIEVVKGRGNQEVDFDLK